MPPRNHLSLQLTVLASSLLWSATLASPTLRLLPLEERINSHLGRSWYPEQPVAPRSLSDTSPYLPAQIGGIVGAYGVSLVLVAIILLSLAKRRREHLQANAEDFLAGQQIHVIIPKYDQFAQQFNFVQEVEEVQEVQEVQEAYIHPRVTIPTSDLHSGPFDSHPYNSQHGPTPYIEHSPSSSFAGAPGISYLVDQSVVAADRAMAQQQLEEMYKHVLEHEDAKQRGLVYEAPVLASANQSTAALSQRSSSGLLSKKNKPKPSSLNLSAAKEDKSQSKASAMFSSLLSPKKKASKGINISSPIMTPMSGTFPQPESREMNAIPHRHYAPPPPPPVPTNQLPFGAVNTKVGAAPLTPDISPESIQTIDERIGISIDRFNQSQGTVNGSERDPDSATSEHSRAPLIGLPSSPKPGSRFPSLPSSPKPGSTFSRANAPSAVRTNGTLPLRAYEDPLASPSLMSHTTKQTVFERKGPMSPGGGRTPFTGAPVPYSPYQPFSPCVPITPSLVTREDRKRMKRMVPKTPTVEMVMSDNDVW